MTNQYKTPKEFFDDCGEGQILIATTPSNEGNVWLSVRELYEHFRNQIFSELGIDEHKSEGRE